MPQYEVSVSCKDLADKDLLSKSDPVLILLENVPFSKRFVEVGKTELIKDCLSPQFAKKFRLSVQPGQDPILRVAVVDIDNFEDQDSIADQEFIGRADFHVSDLLSPVFTASLGSGCGHVTLKACTYDPSLDGLVSMEIRAPACSGGGSVFLELHRADPAATLADSGRVPSDAFTLVLRTEAACPGSGFQPVRASLFTLCRGDPARLLRIECWRRGSRGAHRLLAGAHTCLAQLGDLAAAGGGEGGMLRLVDSKGHGEHSVRVVRVAVDKRGTDCASLL